MIGRRKSEWPFDFKLQTVQDEVRNIERDVVTGWDCLPDAGEVEWVCDPDGRPVPCLFNVVTTLVSGRWLGFEIEFKDGRPWISYLRDGKPLGVAAQLEGVELLRLRSVVEATGLCPVTSDLVTEALQVLPTLPRYQDIYQASAAHVVSDTPIARNAACDLI